MTKQPVKKVPDDYKSPALRRWRIFEITLSNGNKSRHVAGHDVSNDAGRVSSAISSFNFEAMAVTTSSGRQYKLLGIPGWGKRIEKTWRDWCGINGVASELDVTHEYFDESKFFHLDDEHHE